MMTRRHYSSDLTNREWAILEPLIPPPKPGGRSVSWERREIVDAILYILRLCCKMIQSMEKLAYPAIT